MNKKLRSNARTGALAILLVTVMLFPAMASANLDVHVDEQNDNVRLEVKNIGNDSIYLLNSLTVSNEAGKKVYISQDPSSAELLRVRPGITYTFEWDPNNAPEGKYTQKIYQGDDRKNLKALTFDFSMGKKHNKPILYTDKKFYKFGENVDISFINMGTYSIYVNVNNWEIRNRDTNKVVFRLSQDCTFGYGYGNCADSFEPLWFLKTIERTWDQKDTSGNQVAPGKYDVTAEYSNNDPSTGKIKIKTITTKMFYIRPMSPVPIHRGNLNGNGVSADADDLDLMGQASIGEISSDSRYDLNNNEIPADAGDLVLIKQASEGNID